MTDPTDRIADLDHVALPPLAPAGLVRARGEQRRRRARAGSGVLVAAVLLAGGAAVGITSGGSSPDSLQPEGFATGAPTSGPAPTPTSAPTPEATPTGQQGEPGLRAQQLVQASDVEALVGGEWRQAPDRSSPSLGLVICPTGDGYAGEGTIHEINRVDRDAPPMVSKVVRVGSGANELELVRSDLEQCPVRDDGNERDTYDLVESPAADRLVVRHSRRDCTGCETSTTLVVAVAHQGFVGYLDVPPSEQPRLAEWSDLVAQRLRTAGPAAVLDDGFPPEAELEHGGPAWVVALAVTRTADDPRIARALADARAVGYDPYPNPVGCDEGFREGLGLDPEADYHHVSLYFETEADARQFVDAFQPGVVGTTEVRTYCMD